MLRIQNPTPESYPCAQVALSLRLPKKSTTPVWQLTETAPWQKYSLKKVVDIFPSASPCFKSFNNSYHKLYFILLKNKIKFKLLTVTSEKVPPQLTVTWTTLASSEFLDRCQDFAPQGPCTCRPHCAQHAPSACCVAAPAHPPDLSSDVPSLRGSCTLTTYPPHYSPPRQSNSWQFFLKASIFRFVYSNAQLPHYMQHRSCFVF